MDSFPLVFINEPRVNQTRHAISVAVVPYNEENGTGQQKKIYNSIRSI